MWPFKKQQTQPEQKTYIGSNMNYTNMASWSEWDTETAIKEGFKSSVPVFACVKRRYDAVSSVPLFVETMKGGTWERDPNNHLQQLLSAPNPMMSMGELMRVMVTHLDLGGNAYWKKIRDGRGEVSELWPMVPYPVNIAVKADHMVNYYTFGNMSQQIPAEDICQFKYTNPDNMYYGQSPLQASGKAVDVDNAAQAWQKVSMQNRGVPDYLLSYEEGLTSDQVEQVKDRIRETTGPGSAREPLITSKAKVQQLGLSPVEMDFMETRRFSREDVCAAYGVPSALIAEMGDNNLANSETARKVFWLDTVLPLMDELIETLNRCLASEFGSPQEIRIVYDISNVAALQSNLQERVDNATKLWSMGVPFNTINDRLALGFDDIDNGDIGYISSGNIPTSYDFNEEVSAETKREVFDRIIKGS